MNEMSAYIAAKIEDTYNTQGIEAAKTKYKAFFINTPLYKNYKLDADTILTTDGYENCIFIA